MKSKALVWAEAADAWRITPRLLLFPGDSVLAGADVPVVVLGPHCDPELVLELCHARFQLWLTKWIVGWYMLLPAAERSMEATGLVGVVFTTITGLGTMFMNAYLKSGRRWNGSA